MSPEQLEGQAADARSDQFSFCVALYEGLYGQRPFSAATPQALCQAIREAPPAPVVGSRVPFRIRRALLRGLAAAPEARHPSLEALLSALSHKPRWERWRWAGACAGVAAVVGVASGFWLRETTRCTGTERGRVGIWDEGRRAKLEATFRAWGGQRAEQIWGLTSRRLDAYAAALVEMERDSCEATHVRAEQSERMLDLRSACLMRRWGALHAAVELMFRADPAVLERAPESAHALPDLLPCADRGALASVVPPPESPEVRQRREVLQARLAEATAYHEAGQQEQALALGRHVLEGAREVGYRPDEAAAQLLLGYVEEARGNFVGSEAAFRESQRAALAGRDDDMLVRALTGLVNAELHGKARYPEAEQAAQLAAAALERMDVALTPGTAGEFRMTRGQLHHRKGEHEAALADFRATLALWEAAFGAEHPRLVGPLSNMGLVLNGEGRYAEALAHHEHTLRVLERAYGAEHPRCVNALNNIATSLRLQGRVEEAVARYAQALALSERIQGGEHPSTLMVRVNLGDALQRQGKLHEALAQYERVLPGLRRLHGDAHPRVTAVLTSMGNAHADLGQLALAGRTYAEALALQQRFLGPEHPDLALTYNNLGSVKLDEKEYAEARRLLLVAQALWEKALGAEHPKVASVVQNLARVDLEEGRLPAALMGFQRALEMRRKALGREHPKVVVSLTLLGEATRRYQGSKAALVPLEEAVALAEKVELPPVDRGKAQFALARALWESGGDRQRALALAREAERQFDRERHAAEPMHRELEAWLAQRSTGPLP
uniref:Serine/threonine protein kinase n=1 Tax=Stigmatella erecta TaxID=83460 RepID=A0A7U3MW48_9BACT|nr:serine/threonine protein kinase [Stigmatella erecta]